MVTVGECQEADGAGHRAYKIPGNRNSSHPTEKLIFEQKLPLEELVSEAKNWRRLPKEKGLSTTHRHLIFI